MDSRITAGMLIACLHGGQLTEDPNYLITAIESHHKTGCIVKSSLLAH